MRSGRATVAAIATLALLGVAASARAETVSPFAQGAQPSHSQFAWDKKGRWGLKLDMSHPVGREMQMGDVQAGAYYRVTPSLRVGAAVSLGDQPNQTDRTTL